MLSGNDNTNQLDLKKFRSRKGIGQNVSDPRYTITRNYGLYYFFFKFLLNILGFLGVRMPLGQLISNPEFKNNYGGLHHNEYIVYDESQVALRYLVQFRR